MTSTSPEVHRYQRAIDNVTALIDDVADTSWVRPSPCLGWTAHDVLAHLIDAQQQTIALITGHGGRHPAPDPTRDPVSTDLADIAATWHSTSLLVRHAIEGVDATTVVPTPIGRCAVAELLATAVIEPLIHGWDLAIAVSLPIDLDPDAVHHTLAGVKELGSQLAASGMYAPAISCPDGATEQEQLLAATGRDPRSQRASSPRRSQ